LCSRVKLIAIVAVSVASILAFTPCPIPSDKTAITLFSSLMERYRNTSPHILSPSWFLCWLLTSMKKFLFNFYFFRLFLRLTFFVLYDSIIELSICSVSDAPSPRRNPICCTISRFLSITSLTLLITSSPCTSGE